MAEILVFGDSICYGAWDLEGGWVQRLRKYLDMKNVVNLSNFTLVYNLGVSGNSTEDLLKRFEFETNAYLEEKKAKMILFSTGVNDSMMRAVSPNAINPF